MNIPTHIAIIPDGNRRWAKNKNLPTFEGHRVAVEKILPQLIEKASSLNIKYFTFWALSTENLIKRSQPEVENLLNLMRYFFDRRFQDFMKKDIRLKVVGNINGLPEDIRQKIAQAEKKSVNNQKMTVILGINYGGRDEIVRAVRRWKSQSSGKELNSQDFANYLDTKDLPDPDLIIRTGGEKRLSGFLLWQSEYSELDFSDAFFPDFGPEMLHEAIRKYQSRERRFGV